MVNFSESTSTRRPMINQQILRAKTTKRLVSNHGDLLKHAKWLALSSVRSADQVSSGPDKRGVRFAAKVREPIFTGSQCCITTFRS